jgi:redox-sensing transcriptional repressor
LINNIKLEQLDFKSLNLPPRSVERLSKYRRLLSKYTINEANYIYSHDLARMLNLTSVQVRRDLMLVGVSGNHRRGYNVKELITQISLIIDSENGHNLAIVGMGNLGIAVTNFIRKNDTKINIVAGFDINPEKTGKEFACVPCFHIGSMTAKIKELGIEIAVLTISPDSAIDITNILIKSGIKGILNFTSVHLDVPEGVYLKNYDIITSLEEIGFFIK